MVQWIIKTRRGRLDLHDTRVVWRRFGRYTRPHVLSLVVALGAALGAVAMQIAAPWPIQLIFDHVIADHPRRSWIANVLSGVGSTPGVLLGWACAAILLIALLDAVLSQARDVTLARVGHDVVGRLRRDLFSHFQKLPPSVFEQRRTGDLLMRLTGDIQMLRQMLVPAVITVCQSGLTIVAMIVAMFWLNPLLAALGLVTMPITLFAGWRISRQIRKASEAQRDKESVVASIAHDVLGAMSIIQAFNREQIERRRFSRQDRTTVRAGVKTTRLEARLYGIVSVASALALCLILYVGVRSVLDHAMTAGDLLVFVAYLRGLGKPVRNLTKLAGQMAKSTTCGKRVAEVFELEPAVVTRPGATRLDDVRGEIRFEGVSFWYDDHRPALTDVSFAVAPGQRMAIVGHTGAGKSTLAKLLLRFYDPQSGRVSLDGVDLRDVSLDSLRRQIGWVHQDTVLFGMTIAENIALGCPEADGARIREIAQRVRADEFIDRLPAGYETVLGQGGTSLSGGQRQRLALARALLPGPRILLLDEPATGLDAISRQLVEEAWLAPDNKATTLVICHRLRDMERFDRILVLRQGELCESGTHAELLARDGEYAAMIRAAFRPDPADSFGGRLAC
ncbi:MAG: ABC transporter ATP-binding protein [Planctomycetes bacterium]|nr:ABC transporter ATP-binding protein [Planctomycetota bacterium]